MAKEINYHPILSFCLCISCIMFPLVTFQKLIESFNFYLQPFLIVLFGISGIALYAVLGSELRNVFDNLKRAKE